jgi:hypothetical protein
VFEALCLDCLCTICKIAVVYISDRRTAQISLAEKSSRRKDVLCDWNSARKFSAGEHVFVNLLEDLRG